MKPSRTLCAAAAAAALTAACATPPEEPLRLGDPFPAQTAAAEDHNWMVLTYWHVLAVKCPLDGLIVDMLAMAVNERAPFRPFDEHRFDRPREAGIARAEAALASNRQAACAAVVPEIEVEFPAWEKAVEANEKAHNEEIDRARHRNAP